VSNEFAARMVADAFGLLGRRDEALDWLRTAIRLGFVNHPSLTEHAPFLEPLREEREFRELMEPVRQRWLSLVEWERQHVPGARAAER
jgi:hypothetical protein